MKVLFICKANVGRSQMAEAIFDSLAKGKAISKNAGYLKFEELLDDKKNN